MDQKLKQFSLEVLDKTFLLSLATNDEKGIWVADVIFTYDDDLNIYWMSTDYRRHSEAIDGGESKVAGTITATTNADEPEMSLQISGIAERVDGIPEESVFRFFKKRKMPQPKPEDVLNGHFWYKFTPDRIELIYGPEFGHERQTVK